MHSTGNIVGVLPRGRRRTEIPTPQEGQGLGSGVSPTGPRQSVAAEVQWHVAK